MAENGFVKTLKALVYQRKQSLDTKTITAQAIVIPAGIAGTSVNFYITPASIANANGDDIGGLGNTSLSLLTGVFDNEVSTNTADADMSNGDYWVNYLTGKCRGKKKTAGVAESVTFDVWVEAYAPGSGSGAAVAAGYTTILKTITTAGTAERLAASSTPFREAFITADPSNTGSYAYTGASNVDSTNGTPLNKGGTKHIVTPGDLYNLYGDMATSGDKFRIFIIT